MGHTPGPWRIGSASGHTGKARIVRADGRTVCRMELDSIEADARLIAAAPELLDAARHALEWCEQGGPMDWALIVQFRDQLRAAIARAEGR